MLAQGGISRLAPSPTGALHLGHAFSFVLNWMLARRLGWKLLLRLDDLDAPRVASSAHDTPAELRLLGVDWDGPVIRQSERMPRYLDAMRALAAKGLVYESPHSRAEVREAAEAVGAPQEGAGHAVFPRSLRPTDRSAWTFQGRAVNHRLAVPDGVERVQDLLHGECTFDLPRTHGDFIAWTKAGVPSYQLACAVDDAETGVDRVVRGADLLESAALQQVLHRLMGHASPWWCHVPLVRDASGKRLAKRDGDEGLAALVASGVTPDRLRGLVASWLGLCRPRPLAAAELLQAADPDRVERGLRALHASGGPQVDAAAAAWLRGSEEAAATLARHAGGSAAP